jgi:hypothetical protein
MLNFSARIRLGDYNLTSDPDCISGFCAPQFQQLTIAKAIPHPEYNLGGFSRNDIAILILENAVNENGDY